MNTLRLRLSLGSLRELLGLPESVQIERIATAQTGGAAGPGEEYTPEVLVILRSGKFPAEGGSTYRHADAATFRRLAGARPGLAGATDLEVEVEAQVRAEVRSREAAEARRNAFRCDYCGARGSFEGPWSPIRWERAAEAFQARHAACPGLRTAVFVASPSEH
jgi:hypothetical protein